MGLYAVLRAIRSSSCLSWTQLCEFYIWHHPKDGFRELWTTNVRNWDSPSPGLWCGWRWGYRTVVLNHGWFCPQEDMWQHLETFLKFYFLPVWEGGIIGTYWTEARDANTLQCGRQPLPPQQGLSEPKSQCNCCWDALLRRKQNLSKLIFINIKLDIGLKTLHVSLWLCFGLICIKFSVMNSFTNAIITLCMVSVLSPSPKHSCH